MRNLKLLPSGKYQFRRVWPADVRAAAPELPRELKRTFETSCRNTAIRIATQLDIEFERTKREVRRQLVLGEPEWKIARRVADWLARERRFLDHVNLAIEFDDVNGVPEIAEITQAEFEIERILEGARARTGVNKAGHPIELTKEEQFKIEALQTGKPPKVDLSVSGAYEIYLMNHLRGKEDKAAKVSVDQFIEFAGDIALSEIARLQITEWIAYLANTRKQAPGTLRKRLTMMKAIFNYAVDQELVDCINPFVKAKLPKGSEVQVVDRLPFHSVHLAAIDEYLATSRVRDETRHLITLLKFTGCRPSEIGGLKVEDLALDREIPFLHVRWTDDRRLKTRQSVRRVPLIGAALDAANSLSVGRRQGWLFPSLAPSSGDANDNPAMSSRVNKAIRAAGIHKSPSLVLYSFRHTMAAALDQSPGITQITRDRVLGRGKPDNYGSAEQPLQVSLEALQTAIPLLGQVDETLYSPEQLVIKPEPKG